MHLVRFIISYNCICVGWEREAALLICLGQRLFGSRVWQAYINQLRSLAQRLDPPSLDPPFQFESFLNKPFVIRKLWGRGVGTKEIKIYIIVKNSWNILPTVATDTDTFTVLHFQTPPAPKNNRWREMVFYCSHLIKLEGKWSTQSANNCFFIVVVEKVQL